MQHKRQQNINKRGELSKYLLLWVSNKFLLVYNEEAFENGLPDHTLPILIFSVFVTLRALDLYPLYATYVCDRNKLINSCLGKIIYL